MIEERARFLLEDMRDYAREALDFVGQLDDQRIMDDRILSHAIAHTVQIVGEAAWKMPDTIKEAHPDIPWEKASGIRHRLVHAYRTVLLPIVLQTIRQDFPVLIADIDRILAEGAKTP